MIRRCMGILSAAMAALTFATAGCSSSQAESKSEDELQVYAAASLKGAFDEIVESFRRDNPDIAIASPVYDGSSTLVEQISEGAPADVFASADQANMDKILEAGLEEDAPQIFATNKITIAVPQGNPKGIESLKDLEKPDVTVVVCAAEVPCGNSADALFKAADVQVDPVSLEQNVSAVASKVAMGEADAGLVYSTDVEASDGKLEAAPTDVPEDIENRYPIVVLKDAANPRVAREFVDYVMSDKGQEILERFGFGKP